MAITQPIGNVRVMPQAPDMGDPLAGMKAFAVGTQLGQELAGLSLASEKLRFEKAKLKAQEQGLQWEQTLAQFKLKAAQEEAKREQDRLLLEQDKAKAEIAERTAAAARNTAETKLRERELTGLQNYGSPLAGISIRGAPAAPAAVAAPAAAPAEVAPLADAVVQEAVEETPLAPAPAPALAPTFSIETPAAAPAAPAQLTPTFGDASRNPLVRFAVPAGMTPEEYAATQAAQRLEVDRTQLNSTLERLAAGGSMSILRAAESDAIKQLTARRDELQPKEEDFVFKDEANRVWRAPALMVGGKPVAITGPAQLDVEAFYKADPSQQIIDKGFAENYRDTLTAAPNREANIEILRTAIDMMKKSDTISGPFVGTVPEFLRKRVPGLQEGKNVQDMVGTVVQQSLREILGGQFAQREAEQLLNRAFDVTQPERVNRQRAERLLNTLESYAAASAAMQDYFRRNRTLAGYNGLTPEQMRREINAMTFDTTPGAKAPAATSPRAQEADLFQQYMGSFGLVPRGRQ